MTTHLDVLDELARLLTDAGVDADADPRNLRPPCAWISPRTVDLNIMTGGTVRVDVFLIARDNGFMAAHSVLADLLERTLTVVDADEPVALDQSVTLSTGGPLPAYRLTTDIEYCQE